MAPAAYLDECVDLELALVLRQRQFVVYTVTEAGMRGKNDEEQLLYAARHRYVLVTHNGRHFRRLHQQFSSEGRPHGGVLVLPQTSHLPQLALRSAMMLDWLDLLRDHESQLFTWGDLQFRITQGLRLPGYGDAEHRLALGQNR